MSSTGTTLLHVIMHAIVTIKTTKIFFWTNRHKLTQINQSFMLFKMCGMSLAKTLCCIFTIVSFCLALNCAKISWYRKWICWYFETFFFHVIGIEILARFCIGVEIYNSNGFNRTKSWKLITVNCEWNIAEATTTTKNVLRFRANEDEKFSGDNAVTFCMRLKRPHVLTVWL